MIIQGNSFRLPLADNSVHCIVTSIPYWNLRDYGLPPLVFGGRADCRHEWGDGITKKTSDNYNNGFNERWGNSPGQKKQEKSSYGELGQGQFCRLCHAWRGQYGLEPSISLFIQHSVEVARECKRVLRPDGVMWWNLGDTYATGKNGRSAADGKALGSDDRTFRDKPFTVDEIPAKNLCLIPERIVIALQDDGWIVRSVAPWVKCLSGGTVIYAKTQKGEMPMTIKDMVRLRPETVKLWNGEKWTQVLGWQQAVVSPDRKREARRSNYARTNGQESAINYLEIELRSGERIGCTPTHQWPTQRGLIQSKDLQIGDILCKGRLPEPEQPKRPEYIPDEIGWFVGLYLAEGSRSDDIIQIAGHIKETERFERLSKIAKAYGGTCQSYHFKENGVDVHIYSRLLSAIIDTYINGKLAAGKHLAVTCWQRNDIFLRNLLDGYLSGDGHWDAKNNRWRLGFTNNDALASDLRTICARLGVSLRLKRARFQLNEQRPKGWRGQIRFDLDDRSINIGSFRKLPDTEIVAIRQSRARKFWDIAVADEPHLFSLASGVLTHNSNPMPESCQDRPGTAHEYIFMLTKSPRYFWDMEAVRRPAQDRPFAGKDAKTKRPNDTEWHDNRYAPGASGYGHNPSGRSLRTSDFFFDSLDSYIAHLTDIRDNGGLMLEADGSPAAFVVNPKPYKFSHYATFPLDLITPMIKCSTSERGCCRACGAPWVRVVEKSASHSRPDGNDWQNGRAAINHHGPSRPGSFTDAQSQTLGWRPSCDCIRKAAPNYGMQGGELLELADEIAEEFKPVPAIVLDPFVGSGTTVLAAQQLGRRGIGIDLNPTYLLENALPRTAKKGGRSLEDLPLFALQEVA